MKTEIQQAHRFTPVSITLTFETQDELDDWATFSNSAHLRDILRVLGFNAISEWDMYYLLEELGGNIDRNSGGKSPPTYNAIKDAIEKTSK